MYLFRSLFILVFNSASFYFFLILQSVSLFSFLHYFGGLSYTINSLCYILVVLLSDVLIVCGFVSVSVDYLFFGFMLKLSFFPFLWFLPRFILNMSYVLIFFLVFFHKVVVVLLFYYLFLELRNFYLFFILFSILLSSFYLIINKRCLKSLIIWSSKIHCG